MAITPGIQDSGLLAAIQQRYRAPMRVHATDSARAVRMLQDDVVDLVIAQASEPVSRLLREEPAWVYRKLAHNYAVLVGPGNDPANVRGAADGADAFRRIAASASSFVSHPKDAELHQLEQSFWRAAFATPSRARLRSSHEGVAGTLRLASEEQAYTLVDEAVFGRFEKSLNLAVLLTRDRWMLKMYGVIYPRSNDRVAGFGEWLTRGEGRQLVANYRVNGHAAFTVWLEGCPDSYPEPRPCRLSAAGKPIKDDLLQVCGSGPPATARQMAADADAVVVARYTGRSREFSAPVPPRRDWASPRFERLGAFEILETVKPHPAVPAAGARVEIVVPGSYHEYPSYVLHTFAADVDEPMTGHAYVIFVRHLGWRPEGRLTSAWFGHMYDVSERQVRPLQTHSLAFRDRTPTQFLAALRSEAGRRPR